MKTVLRQEAAAHRAALLEAQGDIGPALAQQMEQALDRLSGVVVAGYHPIRTEANVLPVLGMMARRGWQTALPVVAGPVEPLVFRAWATGDDLTPGAYGVKVPVETAASVVPDVVLVPLLACDRIGHRLGYGGGFYDRTLATLRTAGAMTAIGIAYAGQQVEALPVGVHDVPLDQVLTEDGLQSFEKGAF